MGELFSYSRGRDLAALLIERAEWSKRYDLGYHRGWDIRAMDMIRWEMRRIRNRLREEFGFTR
jgi:hypothetical protein